MTPLQLELPMLGPTAPGLNLTGIVREIMMEREWATPAEIQRAVCERTQEWHSDSSLTARVRELRRDEYGAYTVEKRKRSNSRAYEYRLTGGAA